MNQASSDRDAAAREQRRAEWTERVETYAREAVGLNRPFAEALVSLVAPEDGARVLDIATGPGVVAVEAAKRVGPAGTVTATDLVSAWAPYVAQMASEAGVDNVRFAAMPAETIELPDATFDVVLCQFGLMFMPNPVAALREMRRVLRPDGKLGVVVWSVPERVGLFLVPRLIGAALPPPEGRAPPSPTGMGEPGLIERFVAEAGFRDIASERQTRINEIADVNAEWRRWTEDPSRPSTKALATLSEQERARLHDEAIAGLEAFRDGETIRVPSEAILVTATR
jgi:SAM-dependent methyltransferase